MENISDKNDMQRLIGNVLRIGVSLACIVAFVGIIAYIVMHGGEEVRDYATFNVNHSNLPEYAQFDKILEGFLSWNAWSIIQVGVIILIITPIMRVVFSLFDFAKQRDWLYVIISSIVLGTIIFNSVAGIK